MAADFSFHTPDIRDDGLGGEVWGDLMHEVDDASDGSRNDHEGGLSNGRFGRFGDFVAPGLAGKLKSDLGTSGPDDNSASGAASAGSLRDRTAEQAGSQNDKCIDHGFRKTACAASCRAPGCGRSSGWCVDFLAEASLVR